MRILQLHTMSLKRSIRKTRSMICSEQLYATLLIKQEGIKDVRISVRELLIVTQEVNTVKLEDDQDQKVRFLENEFPEESIHQGKTNVATMYFKMLINRHPFVDLTR
jgi:hypothetical protein